MKTRQGTIYCVLDEEFTSKEATLAFLDEYLAIQQNKLMEYTKILSRGGFVPDILRIAEDYTVTKQYIVEIEKEIADAKKIFDDLRD